MYTRYVELRDKKGLKDCDVAKSTNISTSFFSEWKSGKHRPGVKTLLRIASFFKVPLDYFVDQNDYIH